jgi:site-specific recombinase XerC
LVLTPHQFRHLAAKLLLDQQPGNYEGARQLLTHCSLKSTTSFYTELQTPNAARQYDAMLQERRRDLAQLSARKVRTSRRRHQ